MKESSIRDLLDLYFDGFNIHYCYLFIYYKGKLSPIRHLTPLILYRQTYNLDIKLVDIVERLREKLALYEPNK